MRNSFRTEKSLMTRGIDRIDSFLYWKTVVFPYSGHYDVCPLCEGDSIFQCDDGVTRYCKCAVDRWAHRVGEMLDAARSQHPDRDIGDISTVDPKVARAVEYVIDWAERPVGRLVISGGYGTGKSHMLHALDGFYKPVSLYITAADFESSVFSGIGANRLGEYIGVIKRAPILLFDDLGMEYGSPIVLSQLDSVFDYRYPFPNHFPTAVATNYSGNELGTKGRYGSRIMDRTDLVYVGMAGVPDWRLR